MADRMVQPHVLAVASVDAQKRLFEHLGHPHPDLTPGLDEILLGRPSCPQPLLDLRFVHLRLGLGDSSQGTRVDVKQAEQRLRPRSGLEERLHPLRHHQIVLTHVVCSLWSSESKSFIDVLQGFDRHPTVVGQLLIGLFEPGLWLQPRDLQERE